MQIKTLEDMAARLRNGNTCFDEAADLIEDTVGEIERLRGEVAAWHARFPEFTFRPQDACVSLR